MKRWDLWGHTDMLSKFFTNINKSIDPKHAGEKMVFKAPCRK